MSAESYARVLDDPSRDEWQKPHEVLQVLKLRPDDTVADIGAGTGSFARRFAHHAGLVYAVDIDLKLLEIAAKGAPSNLRTVLAEMDDSKLRPGSVDTIFICDVLHHLDDWPAYVKRLKAALKPGGRIVVIDFRKEELPVGPPPAMKIDVAEVEHEFARMGLLVSQRHALLPYQYFIEFRPR